jgi:hypothetical protein
MLDAPDVQTVPVRQFGRGNGFSNSLKAADLADLADFIDLSSLAKRTPQRKNKFGDVERVAGPSLDPASERTYHNTSTPPSLPGGGQAMRATFRPWSTSLAADGGFSTVLQCVRELMRPRQE